MRLLPLQASQRSEFQVQDVRVRPDRTTLALHGEGRSSARWYGLCPSKANNAVNAPIKECECGKTVPTFGLPGKGRPWCAALPSKPDAAQRAYHQPPV